MLALQGIGREIVLLVKEASSSPPFPGRKYLAGGGRPYFTLVPTDHPLDQGNIHKYCLYHKRVKGDFPLTNTAYLWVGRILVEDGWIRDLDRARGSGIVSRRKKVANGQMIQVRAASTCRSHSEVSRVATVLLTSWEMYPVLSLEEDFKGEEPRYVVMCGLDHFIYNYNSLRWITRAPPTFLFFINPYPVEPR